MSNLVINFNTFDHSFCEAKLFNDGPEYISCITALFISFIGFLIGPPLIGFIAELTSLKYSFAIIGIFGIFITVLVSRLKIFKS